MDKTKEKNMFGFLLLLICALMFMIVAPFLRGLAWSLLFCVLIYPLYKKLLTKFNGRYENALAALMTAGIILFMVVPILCIIFFFVSEMAVICGSLSNNGGIQALANSWIPYIKGIPFIGKYFDNIHDIVSVEKVATASLSGLTTFGKTVSGKIMSGTAKVVMIFVVVGFSAFYFLRDGEKMVDFVKDLLPLEEKRKTELFCGIKNTLGSVVYGLLLTAAVQGVIGAIGWYFAGLQNSVFFGFLMFIFGMIPMIGTPIVWGSGVIYLIVCHDFPHAIFLLIWGGGFVCTIDNLIRPVFISSGGELNMLVVFLGLLGGLYLWGFVGLFYGPLVLSMGIYLLEIYRQQIADERHKKPKLRLFFRK